MVSPRSPSARSSELSSCSTSSSDSRSTLPLHELSRKTIRASTCCSDLLESACSDLGRCAGHVEDDPPRDPAFEHVVDRLVDSAQRALLADHGCPSASMEVEHLLEVLASADDGSNYGDSVEDRFEDWDAHRVVSR